jgi:diacylglycerol kinase family enzyme
MGVGGSIEEACERLAGRAAQPIDVGHARFLDHQGRAAERVFLNVLSFGCGGAVAQLIATGAAKRMCGARSFMLASAWTLLRYRDQTVTLSLDGGTPQQISVTNLAVCNGGFFGGGMWAAPGARMDDGRFDVTIWSGFGLRDLILKRRSIYDGTHVHDPGTRLRRAKTLVATSDELVLLEIDGESAGRLPVTIENLPGALRLKV